jgi:hypothetical protein
MKKLVSLVVLLFAVVVMVGAAQAQQALDAKATVSGRIAVSGIPGYLCKGARVTNSNQYFTGTKTTLTDGLYRWYRVDVPSGQNISGTVTGNWSIGMLGVTLSFNGQTQFDLGTALKGEDLNWGNNGNNPATVPTNVDVVFQNFSIIPL